MQTVYVCGGSGTRMRPGHVGPKSLVEVGGESLLSRLVRRFGALHTSAAPPIVVLDASDAVTAPVVRDVLPSARVITQPRPDGVARALALVRPYVIEPAVVVLGDIFLDGPLPPLPRAPALVVWHDASPRATAANFGVATTDAGTVAAVEEKPRDAARWSCGMGVYVVDDQVLGACAACGADTALAEAGITAALDRAIAQGVRMRVLPFHGFYANVNTAADVHAVEAHLDGTA